VDEDSATPAVETLDESPADSAVSAAAPPPVAIPPAAPAPVPITPTPPAFVYALGRVEPRFPSLAIEKEFAQATGNADYRGLDDRYTFKAAINEHRYLARSVCWILVIQGLETYILAPRDPADLDLLKASFREEASTDDLDTVIGLRRHIAPPEMCNGLALPVVEFDQLYSFDRESLVGSIPRPESVPAKSESRFRSTAAGLFDQLVQLADNAGATDEHRALNYLTVRYPRIYAAATEQYDRNFAFTGVEVLPSRLSGVRSIVDVVFGFRHRETDVVEKLVARVDVTEEFPFLVTKLSPFYERP
jgi:hypothetical protein